MQRRGGRGQHVPKARKVPTASITDLQEQLDGRTRDLEEALQRETATSEVLRVISSSPSDLKPVFETILANATRLCGAKFGMVNLSDGAERLRCAKATRDQPRLEPASAAVPSAAKQQKDDYNDEKRGGIHM